MEEGAIFTLVRTIIMAGLAAREMTGWDVAQKFQPRQQGANSGPTVYLFKVSGQRVGSPAQRSVWDEVESKMQTEYTQVHTLTLQASILMQEGLAADALTPGDALNVVADIMQGEALGQLRAQGVGILRVADTANPYDVNDRDQFSPDPSFDFVLTFSRSWLVETPHVESVEAKIYRV